VLIQLTGIAVEVVGTVVTFLGLVKTHQAYTHRSFLPRPRALSWFKFKVLRRPRPSYYAETDTSRGGLQRGGTATWRWTPAPPEGETLEERLARIEADLRAVREHGLDTAGDLTAQRRVVKRVEATATRQVAVAKAELTRQMRDQALDGIRQSALGLVLIAVGSVGQAVGSIAAR